MAPGLTPIAFDDLPGFADDDHLAAFLAYRRCAIALNDGLAATRPAQPASAEMLDIARVAVREAIDDRQSARQFFERWFRPFLVDHGNGVAPGFVTGYYEPVIAGSLVRTSEFASPVLGRPADLVTFAQGESREGFAGLTAAQRMANGALRPYPERAAIEATESQRQPILWLRDRVEVFLSQVQGSASVDLVDGERVRLAYDGRNGHPYTSIGRTLIETGEIAESEMSLECLKQWLRANGLAPGDKARALMQSNRSYVFFRLETEFDANDGPTGGAGVALTALRSIAIDRAHWPYGAPFWTDADLPWQGDAPTPFRRLMIAQDTGSAILGPARADIFFGQGDDAGLRAGAIRHPARFTVLLPAETSL